MSTLDQSEGPDEANTCTSMGGEDKGKSIEENSPQDPLSMAKKNGMTPNGSKRKRKDWRAFARENGGARRRVLRSDMARLRAEAEAGTAEGAGTHFNPTELDGLDWERCGGDLQLAKGKVDLVGRQVKAMVNKESNKCDVGSLSGKTINAMGKAENLGNGEFGAGEKKGGDEALSGVLGCDISSGEEIEELSNPKRAVGIQYLDGTLLEGNGDGGNADELEGKGKGGTGDEATAQAVSGNGGNEQTERQNGELGASCENFKEGIEIESSKVEVGLADIQGDGPAHEKIKTGEEQFSVIKEVKKKGFTTVKIMSGIGDGGNADELEGKGKGGTGDEATAGNGRNKQTECENGEFDASQLNFKEGIDIESLNAKVGPADIQGGGPALEKKKTGEEQFNVLKDMKKKGFTIGKIMGGTGDEATSHAVFGNSGAERSQHENEVVNASRENSKVRIEIETLKVEAGPTHTEKKGLAETEEKEIGDGQINVLKEAKKKGFTTIKKTLVEVDPVIVERRITRSSARKQKRNDENDPQNEGAKIVEGLIEEEPSGIDQVNTDDSELLKNLKVKEKRKKRFERRKSSGLTDSDEEFNPVKKRVREKKAKAEADRDGSVSLGTKREPLSKRKKIKMDIEELDEEFKAVRMDQLKRPEVESEESDSLGSRLETLSKKKKPKIEREDPDSDSDFQGTNQDIPIIKKRRGRLPGSKNKTTEVVVGKMIKMEKNIQGRPSGFKNNGKVVKVDSLSELENKPRKVAKDIVSGMIKDLLKSHGWEIEMRPRNGKDYNDQVHVAPDGTTHWSITKAYYAFLQEMESIQSLSKGKGDQVPDFTPIPEELLGILKKHVCNVRSDCKKRKKLKGKKRDKGKKLGVKSKKFKKKYKFKKKNKKEREKVTSGIVNEMGDAGLASASKKSNPGRGRKKKARLTLLARGSHKEGDGSAENEYVPYQWKRTVLSWMIDLDVVLENGKVKYMDPEKTNPLAEGKICRNGIECNCCGEIFTVSDFGVHAGAENSSSCSSFLFVEEAGVCLLQCLVRAWEKHCGGSEPKGFVLSAEADGVDQNDDTCGVCGDGGNLVCCDGCPSTFHLNCLGMEMLPSGDWRCPYCSCAFCTKLPSFPLLSCTQCNSRCTCY